MNKDEQWILPAGNGGAVKAGFRTRVTGGLLRVLQGFANGILGSSTAYNQNSARLEAISCAHHPLLPSSLKPTGNRPKQVLKSPRSDRPSCEFLGSVASGGKQPDVCSHCWRRCQKKFEYSALTFRHHRDTSSQRRDSWLGSSMYIVFKLKG